jgi:hypothetical protein
MNVTRVKRKERRKKLESPGMKRAGASPRSFHDNLKDLVENGKDM